MSTNFKGFVLVGLISVVAFLWGYSGDKVTATVQDLLKSEAPAEPKPETKAATKQQPAKTKSTATSANDPFNPYKRFATQGRGKPPPLSGPNGQPFGGTLNTIRQGKIRESQKRKRNLYFEKLSEQMQQMKQRSAPTSASDPKEETIEVPKQRNQPTQSRPTARRVEDEPEEEAAQVEELIDELEDEPVIDDVGGEDELADALEEALIELEDEELLP